MFDNTSLTSDLHNITDLPRQLGLLPGHVSEGVRDRVRQVGQNLVHSGAILDTWTETCLDLKQEINLINLSSVHWGGRVLEVISNCFIASQEIFFTIKLCLNLDFTCPNYRKHVPYTCLTMTTCH